ncbi:AEL189Wp [Eremothecium gossypii ATCC 10895]|uniref:chitin synthase n=1 Tax=Eremothecium gossypii (strain ATCC 10895 / CBS 109.51 / FGSC 9923 / NRRL Y-1056) TaxID=284811 RepID=Q758F1_EREGS|nr:AEL189Wp [Eremothecium gossypii ATCC 10895]AAS52496.2 AEL189Wp [Eremothecium gossypii ATCC 10895]AEY96796.1 FAEL189Wp [Eremothecium gossypii FDAG1]
MSDDYYMFDNESLLKSSPQDNLVQRTGSLVRPERNHMNDPSHPHHYYARKAKETRVSVNPSSTGIMPSTDPLPSKTLNKPRPPVKPKIAKRREDDPLSLWQFYCYAITFWAPSPLLELFGMPKKERQFAWREKVGLISVIIYCGIFVAYLTFGFTNTVCNVDRQRLRNNEVAHQYLIIHGKAYNLDFSAHPAAAGIDAGSNVLYNPIAAGGKVASFLFQNVNGNCKGLIIPKENCSIPHEGLDLAWYFPCKLYSQDGSTSPEFSLSEYYDGWACHTSENARGAYYNLQPTADVYFTWEDIKNSTRNLVVYNDDVLDLDLLNWLQTEDLEIPGAFDDLKSANLKGFDISVVLSNSHDKQVARCLSEIVKVGVIDSDTVGCIASEVVLYISLVFILSIVTIKFLVSCYFHWCIARKQGASPVDNKTLAKMANDIEDWSENINSQGPIKPVQHPTGFGQSKDFNLNMFQRNRNFRLDLSQGNLDVTADLALLEKLKGFGITTMTIQSLLKELSPESTPYNIASPRSPSILPLNPLTDDFFSHNQNEHLDPSIIHPNVIPQPPPDYTPFGYPLIHGICFVTCYSENEEGLRTTLDSLSTTTYPNSHKLLMVLCDGLIKGSGNSKSTPEIALDMMEDFVVPPERVQAYSYVAVAYGTKRHNMAKVYSGFYKYDNSTVPPEKQQKVPMICIVKCGTEDEQASSKPGNRGKRDSQVILMSFLQKVTFDERMTRLEFELLKNIWQITGLMSDFYEFVLMVDADTKVYPDSLSHMVAEIVKDPKIMGLCGETKIANKRQSWVTAIQVFEYYISHHQAKAFESIFGSVTCLPGCFSIYRIKCPKGEDGYWVPILCNPDIVERYSDNVTNTLHKKNLLLLGEDRFLSSLMLKTFPKRKQIFVPKAACKTIVPDKFRVLLSQRRRWINSTVHNLIELVLINDLCGTFCFSMQFVIAIELIGTVVLPLAICLTIYVVIFAIVSKPTPVITLILLAIILGLPGILIVVTATRWSYLVWMGIYLLALPIWNFVLPTYAFWKFDDFSWGDTRQVAGGDKGNHCDGEGDFDGSLIQMKTWREYERIERLERTNKLGTTPGVGEPTSRRAFSSMDNFPAILSEQLNGSYAQQAGPLLPPLPPLPPLPALSSQSPRPRPRAP